MYIFARNGNVFQALQFTTDNQKDILNFTENSAYGFRNNDDGTHLCYVHSSEGNLILREGEYVVKELSKKPVSHHYYILTEEEITRR